MRISLIKEDCYCSLLDFYRKVAITAGFSVTEQTVYDCRKICISESVNKMLWDYYKKEESLSDKEISALFLILGPKTNIMDTNLYLADINADFADL